MKTTNQIAAEAWDKICNLTSKGNGKTDDFVSIIQAAIEKGMEATAEHFRLGLYAKLDEAISRAARIKRISLHPRSEYSGSD